ncbi:MarR family winged helix-turn-helix transcriptional regulator [Streptomyces sp. NPDC058385]|uniref:MarR family winged helix-turn-helix transcriptional regulator n=1 Tax=Streptomyces sp. NPDC058385 TaxID=3346473 RepID=UPI003659F4D6
MNERTDLIQELDAALRQMRHGRFGLYGPWIRERFLAGLEGDISPTAYRVLRFVEASSPPPPTMSDIAALLLVDRARAARIIDQLAADDLVTRIQDSVDQRLRRVEITEAGHQFLTTAASLRSRFLATTTADWPDTDMELLIALLGRLNESVTQHLPTRPAERENHLDRTGTVQSTV